MRPFGTVLITYSVVLLVSRFGFLWAFSGLPASSFLIALEGLRTLVPFGYLVGGIVFLLRRTWAKWLVVAGATVDLALALPALAGLVRVLIEAPSAVGLVGYRTVTSLVPPLAILAFTWSVTRPKLGDASPRRRRRAWLWFWAIVAAGVAIPWVETLAWQPNLVAGESWPVALLTSGLVTAFFALPALVVGLIARAIVAHLAGRQSDLTDGERSALAGAMLFGLAVATGWVYYQVVQAPERTLAFIFEPLSLILPGVLGGAVGLGLGYSVVWLARRGRGTP